MGVVYNLRHALRAVREGEDVRVRGRRDALDLLDEWRLAARGVNVFGLSLPCIIYDLVNWRTCPSGDPMERILRCIVASVK